MPPNEDLNDWLGDLKWQGYPRLKAVRDIASEVEPGPMPRRQSGMRVETLARENEALRAKIETLTKLASDFERTLSEAGQAYESAALESDSSRRAAELELARVAGELTSLRAELSRRESRETAREAELSLERERRADAEKALLEARRRLNDLDADLAKSRGKAAELAGSIGELRRQADASHERLVQAKALTDQDVQLLRLEMREFLAKFHRIQESLGEKQ